MNLAAAAACVHARNAVSAGAHMAARVANVPVFVSQNSSIHEVLVVGYLWLVSSHRDETRFQLVLLP
jgi:hypothetical protein